MVIYWVNRPAQFPGSEALHPGSDADGDEAHADEEAELHRSSATNIKLRNWIIEPGET